MINSCMCTILSQQIIFSSPEMDFDLNVIYKINVSIKWSNKEKHNSIDEIGKIMIIISIQPMTSKCKAVVEEYQWISAGKIILLGIFCNQNWLSIG